jgi:hypothetical protein
MNEETIAVLVDEFAGDGAAMAAEIIRLRGIVAPSWPVIDWRRIMYDYLVWDQSGECWEFETMPICDENIWFGGSDLFRVKHLDNKFKGDWKKSLIRRPAIL